MRKWRTIGNDYNLSAAGLVGELDKTEKILSAVVGKNLVPRAPIYLLTILQSLELTTPGDIQNSVLGYYYQYLITSSLGRVNVRVDELEEIYNYCANLAWFYHQNGNKEINIQALKGFNKSYSDAYISIEILERLDVLHRARLLNKRGEYYSFSYPYIYYYFLGMYFSNELHENQEIRNLVQKYCSHLYVREYSTTILFLTHFSKDKYVINAILENLRGLFSDNKPISLENDTSPFNELVETTTRLVFSGGDPEENRRLRGEIHDEIEKRDENSSLHTKELEGDLDLPAKLNGLYKTIEILGQILKNHYGTLRNDYKMELMREVYEGPLRALREFLEAIENDRDAIITDLEVAIEDASKELGESDLKQLAKRILFEFVGMFTFAFLFKTSTSVASVHLRDVSHKLVREKEYSCL